MTIKSDKWITQKCDVPTHRVTKVVQGINLSRYFNLSNLRARLQGFYDEKSIAFVLRTIEKDDYSAHTSTPEGPVSVYKLEGGPQPLITPFSPSSIRVSEQGAKIISRGLSSFGYDVALADDVKIFTNSNASTIDPKRFDNSCLVDATAHTDEDGSKFVYLPPNSYMLGHTIEYFNIPRDVMVVCLGKSTYARAGAIVNVTPIEAGFEGMVVIEVSNSTTLPLKIYLNEGIGQFLFFESDEECAVSYADRNGKYQGQTGLVFSKV